MISVGVGNDSRNCRMRRGMRTLATERRLPAFVLFLIYQAQPPSQADSPLYSVKSNVSSDTQCQSDGYAGDYRVAWTQSSLLPTVVVVDKDVILRVRSKLHKRTSMRSKDSDQ